jgi:phosphoenolpyruvate carboxylase
MGKKKVKEGVCVSPRKIPSTSATQFPDNVSRPFWSLKEAASPSDDFFDCYVAFKEMGCHEYFWDWKGRRIDELLVKKLMASYKNFFRENQIGRDHFITFKVDGSHKVEDLGRLYMSIISTNDFAKSQKMFSPPLFEVVHAASAHKDLFHFASLYNESVSIAGEKLKHDCGPKTISILPTHQFCDGSWYAQVHSYLSRFQHSFRCKVDYLRPVIPRASLADKVGFVSSVLATKRALSNYSSFSKITGTDTYPVLEAGPLMFRGGLSPDNTEGFISTYPGARTVTITPSFRYGYSLEDVKESVSKLNRSLPRRVPISYTHEDLGRILSLEKIFSRHYRSTISKLGALSLHEQLKVGKLNKVAKSLELSFSLYSLGVPPEFIGTGRAILECVKEGLVKDLEMFYPTIKQELAVAGALLNKENLGFLAKTNAAWKEVLNDVNLVQDYCDSQLGPDSAEAFMHRNHTSNVFHTFRAGKDCGKELMAAAALRHCLG